jgi:hypothetical protein
MMRRIRLSGVVLAAITALSMIPRSSAAGEEGSLSGVNHARPFEPATRPAFIPLPPGAVEPAGWLRDWCLAAKDGFTGHMDDYDVEFQRAWAADHQMTGDRLRWYQGAWPYEGGGYWFDGLARLGFALHDDALIRQATRRLHVVAEHMNPDGILFLWWLNRHRAEDCQAVAVDGWPLWACGLLGRALTGHYAASSDRRILQALETAYGSDSDCLRSIPGSLSNVWPAFDTYTWTGNATIAAALDAMFDPSRSALLPHLERYRSAPDLTPGAAVENQHVVEFIECTTPWAVGYLWTGRDEYLRAAVGWHDWLARIAMQPHGVPVSDEWYGPTGAFRGSETCDVAGYVWSQTALLAVSGEGRLGDRAERAFFNAGAATVARDFKTHVYFQSPNRFAPGSPDFPHGPRAGGGNYQPKHAPLCCTAALNRIVPCYVSHMWMATYDNGLAATCYGPCRVQALVADRVPIQLVCQTDYPFGETIDITVSPSREAAFALDFRIPGWCERPELSVNGATIDAPRSAGGFARIDRRWKPGDMVRLHLPMSAVVTVGRDAAESGPYSGEHKPTMVTLRADNSTLGSPYASVSFGPLLFALAIPDTLDANTPDPAARWKFALDVQRPDVTVQRQAMPPRWDWPLDAPITLQANAAAIDWQPDPAAPRLPEFPVTTHGASERITLVPYGCSKFRISMFPVTAGQEVAVSAIRKILFLGNSITWHGPNEQVGWSGSWGMAASAPEKDYVHLVTDALETHTGSRPEIKIANVAEFERNYARYDVDRELKELLAFDPDLVVLAIGENVPPLESEQARSQFRIGVRRILQGVLARRHPLVVVRTCFWADSAKDEILRQVCQEVGGIVVDAGVLGQDPTNAAGAEREFSHAGVAGHPGDKGMRALAEAIVQAILVREHPDAEGWTSLFNGRDLEGWTPKIKGYELGENFGNTFRVENGVLRVSYDQYDRFGGRFGHLFYRGTFSHYVLRVEYRFVGDQCPDGPGWAFRNSGVMIHGQSPESMRKDQDFPVSIEVQLLGGNGRDKRSTGNLCTPGTHVVMDGQLITRHCSDSRSPTFHGDQWVTLEVEVHGDRVIRHVINGEKVLEYEQPQLDEGDPDAQRLIRDGRKLLSGGTISLQSESHPVEFRKVEIRVLEP